MSLNESIVEDAALILPAATLTRPLQTGEERELVPQLREVGHGPQYAPDELAAERDSFGEGVQFRFAQTLIRPLPAGAEKREAILAADPATPEAARATIRNYRIVRFERSTPCAKTNPLRRSQEKNDGVFV